MKRINAKILLPLIFAALFQGCVPEQPAPVSGQTFSGTQGNQDTEQPNASEQEEGFKELYWLDAGQEIASLIIDSSNNKNHYIFGTELDRYLQVSANFNTTYCVYANFYTSNQASTPLMARAIPAVTTNYMTGKKNRYLRVNLGQRSGNDFCNLAVKDVQGNSNSFSALSYHPSEVCPTCVNMIQSTELVVYQYKNDDVPGYLVEVDTDVIDYPRLKLSIDMNGNSDANTPTCSQSACQAQGFDCCVQGQCVNEKAVKEAGKAADPNGFALADQEKEFNPNWYKNYPQFYYSCLENPGTSVPDDQYGPSDPIQDAQDRLQALIADYKCVEELKEKSLQVPFHLEPYNASEEGNYQHCLTAPAQEGQESHYKEVMKRLYVNCGCYEQNDLDLMRSNCPYYEYRARYVEGAPETDSNILDVQCYTPPTQDNQLPFQDLEVTVNSRSAPHRFFNEDGVEIDPYLATQDLPSNRTQEGLAFRYYDDAKLLPDNKEFNMNSILGQMSVGLDQARPAKEVKIEYDKVYYIAALEGLYTPCPSCGKDSWFSNFSAFPSSPQGLGIRATGFTTSRKSWGTNTSFANYEDNIFGRACWLPPTMLPFSHSKDADAQTQRLNRLQTQAALYINGYQRDWYGFNKGALIGSFDGVTWFAIGKGRKVRSTSDTLYLAINAPFADLASPTDHVVSVQEYDFLTTAAQYDYDPVEAMNSPYQNEAGLCQKYHECETDAHCISQLGWEYGCVDVYQYRSKWPRFNPSGAQEFANDEMSAPLIRFLQQGELAPGSSSKRCVYRGAGAPCQQNLDNITDENKRKAMACAPNFYCARLDQAQFNSEVARYGAALESLSVSKNHFFGQDANVLGRPLNYVSHNAKLLPENVKNALSENLELTSAGGDYGICRPGKRVAEIFFNTDPIEQHDLPDTQQRTDYISQIGGCNALLRTQQRYNSCPILAEDGNYLHLKNEYIYELGLQTSQPLHLSGTLAQRDDMLTHFGPIQNSCGLEAVDSTFAGNMNDEEQVRQASAFKTIEGRNLSSSDTQLAPTLVQNACLRRAGSICHTDLDCSPNSMHAELTDILAPSFFGNLAEKKYWDEYLICSQTKSEPYLSPTPTPDELEAFNAYSLRENRCCREVGKDLSMYTEDSPVAPESAGLRSDRHGGFDPNDPARYSRYASTHGGITNDYSLTQVSARRPSFVGDTSPNILIQDQWKLINQAGESTCCGGGWIRKFADGTNDWTRNRLNLNVSNFQCLNYKTPLKLTDEPALYHLTEQALAQDQASFCPDPSRNAGGCALVEMDNDIDNLSPPRLDDTLELMMLDSDSVGVMNTTSGGDSNWQNNLWSFMPFLAYDAYSPANDPVLDWSKDRDDVEEEQGRFYITTRVPAFIPVDSGFTNIAVFLENPTNSSARYTCTRLNIGNFDCNDNAGWGGLCQNLSTPARQTEWGNVCPTNCCYVYNQSNRVIKAAYHWNIIQNGSNYFGDNGKVNSLEITYRAPGTKEWETENASPLNAASETELAHRRSSEPASALYYLKKLAKLEYIGIPQMTYEPLFCNDIYSKLVPGIFDESLQTAHDFINSSETFTDPSLSSTYWEDDESDNYDPSQIWTSDQLKKVADQQSLAHEPIFSDHDFKCCMPLGTKLSEYESQERCCSGFAAELEGMGPDSGVRCALPSNVNLYVYLNKFVSSEGMSSEHIDASIALDMDDFDPKTGEPKFTSAVSSKVRSIGNLFCASGEVGTGGAYGPFDPRSLYVAPSANGLKVRNFVDSFDDIGNDNNAPVGYDIFQRGMRWNHHLYCQ